MDSKYNNIIIKKNLKKIKREGKEKDNIFSKNLKSNLTKYILNYLDLKIKICFCTNMHICIK